MMVNGKRYLVAGCGQVGAGLARALVHEGHQVVVLDPEPGEARRLGAGFSGRFVPESPLDREVLVRAGIEHCDGLAAVFHEEATNVAVALAARRLFHVPRVVARLTQPHLIEIYQRLGIQTLCPQRWGVNRLVHLLCHSALEVVANLGSNLDLVEVRLPLALAGRAAEDLGVPQEIQVVLVKRGRHSIMAGPGLRFEDGDVLQVMVRGSSMQQLRNLLS